MVLQAAKHPQVLIKLLTDELKVGSEDILDFELCLADAQPSVSTVVKFTGDRSNGSSYKHLCRQLQCCAL